MKRKTKKHKKRKWDDTMYVSIYEMARAGMLDKEISQGLGISRVMFVRWKQKNPAILDALERGKKPTKRTADTFKEFVFGRLDEDLQDLWNEIEMCEEGPTALARIESMMASKGKRARQQLYIHALIGSNFNVTAAMRRIGMTRKTLALWSREKEFEELLDEINLAKKDFIEAPLMELVQEKNVNAVLFANKALNKDRGYGDKTVVEHTGNVSHQHNLVNIDDLMLPIEVRIKILEAMENREQNLLEHKDKNGRPIVEDVIDAEFTETVPEKEDQVLV